MYYSIDHVQRKVKYCILLEWQQCIILEDYVLGIGIRNALIRNSNDERRAMRMSLKYPPRSDYLEQVH